MTAFVMAAACYDPFCRKQELRRSGSGPFACVVSSAIGVPETRLYTIK
jgi:hypothetical protein